MEANEVRVGMEVRYKDANNRDKTGKVVKVMDFGVCVRADGKRVYLQANALTPVVPEETASEEQQHDPDPGQPEEAEDGHVTLTEEQSRALEAAGMLDGAQPPEAPAADGPSSQPEAADERPEGTRRDVQALEHEEAPAESPGADEPQDQLAAEQLEGAQEPHGVAVLDTEGRIGDGTLPEQATTETAETGAQGESPRAFDVAHLRWYAHCLMAGGCVPVRVLQILSNGTAVVIYGMGTKQTVQISELI